MGQSTGAFQTFPQAILMTQCRVSCGAQLLVGSAYVAYIADETDMQGASACTLAAYIGVFNAPHKSS